MKRTKFEVLVLYVVLAQLLIALDLARSQLSPTSCFVISEPSGPAGSSPNLVPSAIRGAIVNEEFRTGSNGTH